MTTAENKTEYLKGYWIMEHLLVTKLKYARNQVHNRHGVPISEDYANFLEAIGAVCDALEIESKKPHLDQAPYRELLVELVSRTEIEHYHGAAWTRTKA
jgi:hypothetical protein